MVREIQEYFSYVYFSGQLQKFTRKNLNTFWNIVPIYCDDVIIRGITVNSVGIPRGDGIDIDSSTNVLIEYCTLLWRRLFTMKANKSWRYSVNKPTSMLLCGIVYLKKAWRCTCGSETAGVIQNLYVHDCVFSIRMSGYVLKHVVHGGWKKFDLRASS